MSILNPLIEGLSAAFPRGGWEALAAMLFPRGGFSLQADSLAVISDALAHAATLLT